MAWIPAFLQSELRSQSSQYLTKDGDLVISSQRSRTQEANKEDCFQKLASIIVDAGDAGIEGETSKETKAKVGRLIRKDNEQRIKHKKIHSSKKSARRSKGDE